jgi:hypothetical protein
MGETANAETQYVFLFLFLCCMCFGENYQCPLTATGIWFDNIVLFWKRILTLFMNDQMVGSKLEFVFFLCVVFCNRMPWTFYMLYWFPLSHARFLVRIG